MSLNILLSFTVFVIGSFLAVVLFFKHQQLSVRLFCFSLLTLSYNTLLIFLFESRYLSHVPFLLRTPSILSYLTFPALFLYISFVLQGRERFYWYDLLHLVPALIYVIDYTPLYLASSHYKRLVLEKLYANPQQALQYSEGWLVPPNIHYFARHIIGLLYTAALGMMLIRYKAHNQQAVKQRRYIFNWMVTITVAYALFALLSMAESIAFPGSYGWLLMVINTLAVFAIISLILFFNPAILYGTSHVFKVSRPTNENNTATLSLAPELMARLQVGFENYLERKDYLQNDVTLKKVANELKTQPHILSSFLNHHYRMHFNELINYYRVQYIKAGMVSKQWENFTLEAIAESAGFNNRTTFLSAFKKFTGMTPSSFMLANAKDGKATKEH
jgi:AraC-like DNA-binding protein